MVGEHLRKRLCARGWSRSSRLRSVRAAADGRAQARGTEAYLMVLAGGDAGLRLGEIIALEWRDIDLAARRLTVERSDWLGHVTVPKGGRSRQLPMTQRLTAAVKTVRHLRDERVLCLPDGSPVTRDRVIKAVRGAQRAAGIEQGVHILRHTFCSHLAMKGAPARAIQDLAGHADLSTTHPPSRCALRRTRRSAITWAACARVERRRHQQPRTSGERATERSGDRRAPASDV